MGEMRMGRLVETRLLEKGGEDSRRARGRRIAQERPPRPVTQLNLESLVRSAFDSPPLSSPQATQKSDVQSDGREITRNKEITIKFKVYEQDKWRISDILTVNPSEPSEVERVAKKYIRKSLTLYDSSLRVIRPSQCFSAATEDRINMILLMAKETSKVDGRLVASVSGMFERETEREKKRTRL